MKTTLKTAKSCPEIVNNLIIYEEEEYEKFYSTTAILKELYSSKTKNITFIADNEKIKIKLNNDKTFELNHSKLNILYSVKNLCILIKEKEFKNNIDHNPVYEIKFNRIYKLLNVLYYLKII
tara:strand:- start:653 stop:1018 length:366 start_codon:yes stop_codon:yes gene_type:complete